MGGEREREGETTKVYGIVPTGPFSRNEQNKSAETRRAQIIAVPVLWVFHLVSCHFKSEYRYWKQKTRNRSTVKERERVR